MSEHAGDGQRTEKPTPRRLAKAREEGQVPRAHGLGAGAVVVAGAAIVNLAGPRIVELLELCLRRGLTFDGDRFQDPLALKALAAVVVPGLAVVGLFLVVTATAGLIANLTVGGWSFSVQLLLPDLTRLAPARGLRQLASRTALLELLKALVKFIALGVVAFWLIRSQATAFVAAAAESWPRAPAQAAMLWSRLFLVLSATLAGLAALEIPYQIWDYRNRLKMTRQEVIDEARELDGNPQTKRRIRLLRRRMARMRMAAEVPKADVVVTNPEHYAAALQYHEDRMRAPRLVAKGSGLTALRIREIAAEHHVPIVEAAPLARAICRYVELEDEIPSGLYPPVAEVLAYVYRLRAAQHLGKPAPPAPRDNRFEPPPEFAA